MALSKPHHHFPARAIETERPKKEKVRLKIRKKTLTREYQATSAAPTRFNVWISICSVTKTDIVVWDRHLRTRLSIHGSKPGQREGEKISCVFVASVGHGENILRRARHTTVLDPYNTTRSNRSTTVKEWHLSILGPLANSLQRFFKIKVPYICQAKLVVPTGVGGRWLAASQPPAWRHPRIRHWNWPHTAKARSDQRGMPPLDPGVHGAYL